MDEVFVSEILVFKKCLAFNKPLSLAKLLSILSCRIALCCIFLISYNISSLFIYLLFSRILLIFLPFSFSPNSYIQSLAYSSKYGCVPITSGLFFSFPRKFNLCAIIFKIVDFPEPLLPYNIVVFSKINTCDSLFFNTLYGYILLSDIFLSLNLKVLRYIILLASYFIIILIKHYLTKSILLYNSSRKIAFIYFFILKINYFFSIKIFKFSVYFAYICIIPILKFVLPSIWHFYIYCR